MSMFNFKQCWILSRSRNEILTLISVGSVCMCSFVCYSLPAPFFTTEANKRDISTTVVGLLYGTFELVVFLLSPVFGKYLPKLGYKKAYLVGVLLSGISTIILGTLYTINNNDVFIVCCFIVRIIEAIGAATCLTAAYSFATSIFRNHVPTVMGIIEMFNGLGLTVGPAIGSGLYQVGGFGLPFYTAGVFLILCGLVGIYILPKITDNEETHTVSILVLLRNPPVVITGISVFVAACGVGFLEPTLTGRLSELDISAATTGWFFVILPLVYAVSSPFVGSINEKTGCGRILLIAGLLVAFLSFIMIGPTPLIQDLHSSVTQLIVSSVCFGLSMSFIIVPSLPLILKTVIRKENLEDNLETYSIVAGFVSASFSLGAFLGPIIGGVMVDHLKFPMATTYYAFTFCLVCVIGLVKLIVEKLQKRKTSVDHIELINSRNSFSISNEQLNNS